MEGRKSVKDVKISLTRHPLVFKKPARTSRNVLKSKPSFLLTIRDRNGRTGVGECSLIPGLSLESESKAEDYLMELTKLDSIELNSIPEKLPAVRFAVETALNDFYRDGNERWSGGIEINGLVWMESIEGMLAQVDELVAKGFKTIKLKVGTMPFFEELKMLEEIRRRCPKDEFTIRIDANGAFGTPAEDGLTSIEKLEAMEHLCLHSIEQPIEVGKFFEMKELCLNSPIPIALDEELIGVHKWNDRFELLDYLRPAFIVLKPSLLGGLESSEEFIEIAEKLDIGWWATSALESNVGLAAISGWTVKMRKDKIAQGLGTGSLFTNNTETTLNISEGRLYSHHNKTKPGILFCAGLTCELSKEGALEFKNNLLRPKWTDGIAEALDIWFNHLTLPLKFKTSGSSGVAREITHSREAVIASAEATIEFFDLKEGCRLGMALPIDFVAGRLMLIRAIVGGCDIEIVEPTSKPIFENPIDFLSLTPHQCTSLLPSFPKASCLLLGGGAVSENLRQNLPKGVEVWEGFGMTETITHVAVRQISKRETETETEFKSLSKMPFVALDGIYFKISERGNLIISATARNVLDIITDDLVELIDSKSFIWIGRESHIINSGGIKVNPEFVEREIREIMSPINCDYIILGRKDELLGEMVVLKIDIEEMSISAEIKLLKAIASLKNLPHHHAPRKIEYGKVSKTNRGKTKRV
ncbi:MAG: hypothetical protein COA49_02535 [Bacteroidetes bacterium]|nr:MAG: hypothetical protein COA49_02535 [Bacteroidota bacterium]